MITNDYCYYPVAHKIVRDNTTIKCIRCNCIFATRKKGTIPYLATNKFSLDYLKSEQFNLNHAILGCILKLGN